MAEANSKRRWTRLKGMLRACVECGEQFQPKTSKQKCCGAECANKAAHRTLMKRKSCVCIVCNKTFMPKRSDRTTCCSRECGFELRRIKARRAAEERAQQAQRHRECRHCGSAFSPSTASAAYCCDACRVAARSVAQPEYKCKQCGQAYEYKPTGGRPSAFCGDACRREARKASARADRKRYGNKARKRARYYGVEYEPINVLRVFERDGWRCQICGKEAPQQRRGSRYPNAPELDHRTPLSRGGPHTYSNVQCVCRACNIRKGNRSEVGQLPLLAA